MCRSIKVLHRAEDDATNLEVHEAALQFVRKISGYRKPSQANEAAFTEAVSEVEATIEKLLRDLEPRRKRPVAAAQG